MRRGFGGRAPDFNLDIQHSRSAVQFLLIEERHPPINQIHPPETYAQDTRCEHPDR